MMDNNRILAFALLELSGLFSRVNHLALGPQRGLTLAKSPIVVMEFYEAEDKEENHDFLLAVIAHEVRQRKLVFQRGPASDSITIVAR